jgi:hypothetical protein
MARKLICKKCWISVVVVRKPTRVVGGPANPGTQYKHKDFRDATGAPYCGQVILHREDLEWGREVSET